MPAQIFNLSFRNKNINAIVRVNMPFGGGSILSDQELRDRVRSEACSSKVLQDDGRLTSARCPPQAATLKWLHENTKIPVARVFTYDEDPGNVVGAAYMIQEKASYFASLGRPLLKKNNVLDLRKTTLCSVG
jgi:hypothetical protein